jgi:hypothetical protein
VKIRRAWRVARGANTSKHGHWDAENKPWRVAGGVTI